MLKSTLLNQLKKMKYGSRRDKKHSTNTFKLLNLNLPFKKLMKLITLLWLHENIFILQK